MLHYTIRMYVTELRKNRQHIFFAKYMNIICCIPTRTIGCDTIKIRKATTYHTKDSYDKCNPDNLIRTGDVKHST